MADRCASQQVNDIDQRIDTIDFPIVRTKLMSRRLAPLPAERISQLLDNLVFKSMA